MGERGMQFPAAEGAIHPETLRQKDRSCSELWRAAFSRNANAHRWGNALGRSNDRPI
jgi:hypothetical protein